MDLQGLDLPSVSYMWSSTQVNQGPTPSEEQIRACNNNSNDLLSLPTCLMLIPASDPGCTAADTVAEYLLIPSSANEQTTQKRQQSG